MTPPPVPIALMPREGTIHMPCRRAVVTLALLALGAAPLLGSVRVAEAQGASPFTILLQTALSPLGALTQHLALRDLTASAVGDSTALSGEATLYGTPVQIYGLLGADRKLRRILIDFSQGLRLHRGMISAIGGDSAAAGLPASLDSLPASGRIVIDFSAGGRMRLVRLTASGGPWQPLGSAGFTASRVQIELSASDPTTGARRVALELRGELAAGGTTGEMLARVAPGRPWRIEATFASLPLGTLLGAGFPDPDGQTTPDAPALPRAIRSVQLEQITVVLEPGSQSVTAIGASPLGPVAVQARLGGSPEYLVVFAPPLGFRFAELSPGLATLDAVRLEGTAVVFASSDRSVDAPMVMSLGAGARRVRAGLTVLASHRPDLVPPELTRTDDDVMVDLVAVTGDVGATSDAIRSDTARADLVAAPVATATPDVKPEPTWIASDSERPLPPEAIPAGRERDGTPLYACRAMHQGVQHPGKRVSDGRCHIGWGGQAVQVSAFELLAAASGTWAAPADLARAYVAGSEHGKPLYLCRAPHEGGVHPGKMLDGKCNIAYADLELELLSFEVFYP